MNKQKILVPLNNNSYEVIIKQGLINDIGEELDRIGISKNRKILIVSNKEISDLFGEKVIKSLKKYNFSANLFNIRAGESYKNLATLSDIYNTSFEVGLDRNSLMIALGGGDCRRRYWFCCRYMVKGYRIYSDSYDIIIYG